jgi:CRP-like cAMP-binding protein
MIMSFAAIVHVFACLFHLTARYNEFDYTTWVYNTNYGYNLGKGHAYMYATSVHWAMTSISGIGYGDITPYSSLEKGLAMIWMSFGTIFVSLSASQFTSILNNLIKKDLMIDEQMKMVKDFSKSSQLDGVTRNQLKKYIRDQKIVTEKFQIYTAIKNVDDELKYEIATNIYKKAVKRISFLYEKDKSFVADVVFRLEFVKYENHEQIWSKGSYSDGIYFIIGGRVKIFHQGIFFFTYQEGSFFGDLELVLKTERKFEAVAVDTCKCLRMNEEVFEYFKENYPIYYKELKGMQETRKLNILKALTEMVMIFRYRGNLGMINSQSLLETRNELEKELELSKIFVAKNVQIQGFISGLVCFAFYKTRIKSLLKTLLPSPERVKFEKPVISHITQDQPKLTSENEPENLSLDSISLKSP